MAIIKGATLFWLNANPTRGRHFQNKKTNPEKWDVQLRTSDKKEADRWKKEYGFKITLDQDDDGAVFYRTPLSNFTRSPDGELNKPVTVILGNGEAIDPDTVGNGSIGNVSFSVKKMDDGGMTRRLKGIQVTTWKKFERSDSEDEFELTDDVEIIEDSGNDEDDDY